MSKFRIAKDLVLKIHPYGDCVIHSRSASGEIQLCKKSDYTFFTLKESQIVEGLISGAIKVNQTESTKTNSVRKNEFAVSFIEFSTEQQRKEALRRYQYISEILKEELFVITKESVLPVIQTVAQRISDRKPPSFASIYRWHKRFVDSQNDIRSLIPFTESRGNRKNKLAKERDEAASVQKIIDEEINTFFLTEQRNSVPELYSRIVFKIDDDNKFREKDEKLNIPHLNTIYRRINKLDPYVVDLARYGKRYAERKYKVVQHRNRATRVLEEAQMDHCPTDLMVVDDETRLPIGRPVFTSAIDNATSSICGFYLSFHPPSYVSVMNCLLHSIPPKTYVKENFAEIKNDWNVYGVPETILVDNGLEFYSKDFEDACLQLGIVIQYHPPRYPNYKGIIERFFRTLNQKLLHQQPGTTFSNIFDLKDYDPKKNAVISLSTLIKLIHIFIIDVYQQEIHHGIKEIPARKWVRLTSFYPPLLPTRLSELDIVLGAIDHRTVSNKGIAWNNLQYNSEELGLIRRTLKKGEKVAFKYNPLDISYIYVANPKDGQYIHVPALWQEYAKGLTLWQHKIIQRYNRFELKKDYDFIAICKAKELIRKIVSEEWLKKGKLGNRKRLARFLNYGGNEQKVLLNSKEKNTNTKNFFDHSSFLDANKQSKATSEVLDDYLEVSYAADEIDVVGWEFDFNLNTKNSKDEEK